MKMGDPVHTMDTYPPLPYPIWYVYSRAMMLPGISSPSLDAPTYRGTRLGLVTK